MEHQRYSNRTIEMAYIKLLKSAKHAIEYYLWRYQRYDHSIKRKDYKDLQELLGENKI